MSILQVLKVGSSRWDAANAEFVTKRESESVGYARSTEPPLLGNGWEVNEQIRDRAGDWGEDWKYGWWSREDRVELIPLDEAPIDVREAMEKRLVLSP